MTTQRLVELMQLHAEPIDRAVDRFGLPLHVLFMEQAAENASGFVDALGTAKLPGWVALAVKSNPCRGAVRAAKKWGLGADVASENELRLALEEGIPPPRIVCNGNAKSAEYLILALKAGCRVAVDNEDELLAIEQLTSQMKTNGQILLRFRGMPLSGFTSADQTTAAEWTKFGFSLDEAPRLFARLAKHAGLAFRGVSAHIGAQIADPRGYQRLFGHLLALTEEAGAMGLRADTLDVGGGFPVSYLSETEWSTFQQRLRARLQSLDGPAVTWNDIPMGYENQDLNQPTWHGKAYWSRFPQAAMLSHILQYRFEDGRTVVDRLHALGSPALIVEPGRALLASAGVTLAQVGGVKQVLGHHVVSLELGINNHGTNLVSPDMFPAAVLPRDGRDEPIEAFLAGRLCFSGDMISKVKVPLNRMPRRGDRLVLYHTGAYCADHFASHSCAFLRPAKVAVRADGSLECWRSPETFDQVFGRPEDDLTI